MEVGKLNRLKPTNPNIIDVGQALVSIDDKKGYVPFDSSIAQRVAVPMDRVEQAITFWKPLYVNVKSEGRLLNGIEAFELGKDDRVHPEKTPYIAMCNLMALEALKIMGDAWPTVESPESLMHGGEREKLVADYWKKTFAPTIHQASWAWSAVMAVMAGNPPATSEILYKFREQLP